tara:strand:- start:1366 stop:1551 length:186 start_codon:yes stop_codon:yes gene_type:complete
MPIMPIAQSALTHALVKKFDFILTPVCSYFGSGAYIAPLIVPPNIPKTKAKNRQGSVFAHI